MLTTDQLNQLEPKAREFYELQRKRGYEADDQTMALSSAISLQRIASHLGDLRYVLDHRFE